MEIKRPSEPKELIKLVESKELKNPILQRTLGISNEEDIPVKKAPSYSRMHHRHNRG